MTEAEVNRNMHVVLSLTRLKGKMMMMQPRERMRGNNKWMSLYLCVHRVIDTMLPIKYIFDQLIKSIKY